MTKEHKNLLILSTTIQVLVIILLVLSFRYLSNGLEELQNELKGVNIDLDMQEKMILDNTLEVYKVEKMFHEMMGPLEVELVEAGE